MDESLIEIVAGAMCFGKDCRRNCPDVEHAPCPDSISSWRNDAERILSALEAKGMVVVPKDATVAMVVAGCNALGNNAARGEIMAAMLSREVHALALTKMRLRFAAMLAAASPRRTRHDRDNA